MAYGLMDNCAEPSIEQFTGRITGLFSYLTVGVE